MIDFVAVTEALRDMAHNDTTCHLLGVPQSLASKWRHAFVIGEPDMLAVHVKKLAENNVPHALASIGKDANLSSEQRTNKIAALILLSIYSIDFIPPTMN
jgi:hypothetical protein